ncbi:MAG: universal stress protein [Candidatus Aminicenantes bacterium]|nr:MAG: universal stress protein [Candidatus Aminicenantes bacterium]
MPGFLKKILWTTDFSDEAQEALLYADAFRKTFKAQLIALHVVPDFSSALYSTTYVIRGELSKRVDFLKREAKAKLETLKKAKKLPLKIIVKEGTASKKIIETAEEEKVDMIVIGRRGMSAIEKLFIGSVANQVLRTSSVPVLVTKKKSGKPQFKKILVPTDFEDQEEVERDFAWKLAKGFGSDITLLHVLELHDYEFTPKVLDEMFKLVLKRLKQRKKREKEDIKVKEEVYRAINASIGIVDYAETHNFDLIVISTCVQGKLERFFLGSTTEKVISYSHVPICALPPSWCA